MRHHGAAKEQCGQMFDPHLPDGPWCNQPYLHASNGHRDFRLGWQLESQAGPDLTQKFLDQIYGFRGVFDVYTLTPDGMAILALDAVARLRENQDMSEAE